MGKYDPLEAHLRRQRQDQLEMSFRDVEHVLGAPLPRGAQRPQWWANERDLECGHVQCRAWLRAGYEASVSMRAGTVRFTRTTSRSESRAALAGSSSRSYASETRPGA